MNPDKKQEISVQCALLTCRCVYKLFIFRIHFPFFSLNIMCLVIIMKIYWWSEDGKVIRKPSSIPFPWSIIILNIFHYRAWYSFLLLWYLTRKKSQSYSNKNIYTLFSLMLKNECISWFSWKERFKKIVFPL